MNLDTKGRKYRMPTIAKTYKDDIIERFGLEAVPKELRTTRWFDYLYIQLAFSVNAGNFLVPAMAVLEGGLPFFYAVLSTVIGATAAFFFVSWLSIPGATYGIPAQYAIRSIIGIKGAKYISSPIRTITSLYWFAVQTIGGTFVLKELFQRLFQISIPFIAIAIILSSLMAILALIGFDAIKKATKYFIPFLLLGQGIILYLLLTRSGNETNQVLLNNIGTPEPVSSSSFFFFAGLAFVQYVSGVTSSSDIARYSKSTNHSIYGLFIGNVVGFIMTAILGAYTAAVFGHHNPFVSATHLTDSSLLIISITLCALVSMISINMSNAYTGGFSLLNSLPNLGRIKSAIAFGILGISLSCFPNLVSEAKQYITLLGAFVIPLSAVIITDFILFKKSKIEVNDLENIFDKKFQLNKTAFLTISLGIIIYFFISIFLSPGIFTFIITSGLYYLFNKVSICKNREQTTL
jgi:purine-cytosine permease-like protein